MNYKTLQDLESLKNKNSIKPLIDFTKSYLEGQKVQEFVNGNEENKSLKEQYKELYPDTKIEKYDRFGNTLTKEIPIVYVEYSAEKEVIDSTGNITFVPDIPEDTELKDSDGNNLPLRPTFEYYEKKELDKFLKTLEITEDEIKEFAKPYFIEIISKLADKTHEEAEAKIAEVDNISEKQIQRYKLKADIAQKAKDGDKDAKALLQTEANLVGIDIDNLIDLILSLANSYNKEVNDYISLIEAFRVAVKAKYDLDYKAAIDVALEAKKLGTNTTPNSLQALFNKNFT